MRKGTRKGGKTLKDIVAQKKRSLDLPEKGEKSMVETLKRDKTG